MTLNKVMMIGYAGTDPGFRQLEGGYSYANIRLATTESFIDKNGQRESRTEWHSVLFWRTHAELAQKYIRKGCLLFVEGKIRNRNWEDKEGVKHYTTEIVADSFRVLGRGDDEKEIPEGAGSESPAILPEKEL